MRKLFITLAVVFLGASLFAETGTIAAGSTSVTFTNSSTVQKLFVYNVAVKSATATNDTYSVRVTKDGVDYQIGTVSGTTNSVYGNSTITNKVLVGPEETYKIVRSVTNYAANVFVDIRD